MNPHKIYDYLTVARQRVFDWARPLSAENYVRQFPIGLGSIGRTLTHIMICEYAYVLRIEEKEVPPYEQFPFQDETPPPLATLEMAWTEQAGRTRAVLEAVRDWDTELEYIAKRDDRRVHVTASRGDLFTQLALHEVHHRAQVMSMLRQLGAKAEDIDYSYLTIKRRELPKS